MGEKCKVLMKIASGKKTSSYMIKKGDEYFKLNVPNMIEDNEIELKELKLEKLKETWIDRYKSWNLLKQEELREKLIEYKKTSSVLRRKVSGGKKNMVISYQWEKRRRIS